VQLVVSKGPALAEVPDVIGRPVLASVDSLSDAGFVVADPIQERYDSQEPKGNVLSQDPGPRDQAKLDSAVTLIISKGPAPVRIPDVHGLSYGDAAAQLVADDFRPVRKNEFNDEYDAGLVIRTEPGGLLKAEYGSRVTVYVSKGPDIVTVPDVEGLTADEATDRLEGQGLSAVLRGYRNNRVVRSQDPEAGEKVKRGSEVTINFR
jgi:serine/threonine-protein kinase